MTGPDLDMRKLRYFVAVAEELNFGRAAERLHIAQPVLSRQIRALERELKVTLLLRDSRGTALTTAGAQLLDDARFMLSESVAVRERLVRATTPTRVVRVGVMPGLLATAVVRSFESVDPSRRAEITQVTWTDQVQAVKDRSLDVVFAREPFDHTGLGITPLLEEPMNAVLPAEDPLTARPSLLLADLADHVLIQDPATVPQWAAITTRRRSGGSNGTPRTMEEKLETVAAGRGFIVLPRSTTTFYRRPDVRVVPIDDLPPGKVTMIWDAATTDPLRDAFLSAALACRDQVT